MENEVKKTEEKEITFPYYADKKDLLLGIQEYRGKNFLFISEVYDYTTGKLIKEEQKPVYEKYVDSTINRMMKLYNDKLQYHPKDSNIVIVTKNVKPGIEDDLFSVKSAKGSTKRQVIDLRH